MLYSLFWGVIGLGWVKLIMPLMNLLFENVHIPFEKALIGAFLAFFVFDAALSAGAAVRMDQRQKGVPASNGVEVFLDAHFDDEKMHEIYANSKSVKE